MVLRKSNTNVLQCVAGKKIESMCLHISKNVLSDNRYRKGCAFKSDLGLGGRGRGGGRLPSKFSKFYGLYPPPVESNSLGTSGVCVRFTATQKCKTSEEGPFVLGWSILIGVELPKTGWWGPCPQVGTRCGDPLCRLKHTPAQARQPVTCKHM